MQRLVDNVIALSKETVKTFTYESLNNIVRLINGFSAMLLAILPGKASILEGMNGWELRPTFRGPRLPRWMENGVSSFNQFIHEASIDSDTSSSAEYLSDGEDNLYPGTPLSQSSRFSRERSFSNHDRSWMQWIMRILSWLLFPVKFLLGAPLYIFRMASRENYKAPIKLRTPRSSIDSPRRLQSLRDSVFQRATNQATDRRRGVIEDLHLATEISIESVFDVVHKAAHCLLSPLDTMRRTVEWFTTRNIQHEDIPEEGLERSQKSLSKISKLLQFPANLNSSIFYKTHLLENHQNVSNNGV